MTDGTSFTARIAVSTPVSSETFPRASTITYEFDARGDMPPVFQSVRGIKLAVQEVLCPA